MPQSRIKVLWRTTHKCIFFLPRPTTGLRRGPQLLCHSDSGDDVSTNTEAVFVTRCPIPATIILTPLTVSAPVSHGDTSRCQCQVSDGRKYGRGHLLQSEPEAARQDITRGMPSVWLCLWIYVLWYFVDKRNQLNNNEQKFFTRFAALCEMASWLTFWVSGSSHESLRIWKIKKCCNFKKVFLATRRCNFTVKMELCAKRIITISRIACDFDITKVCSELHFAASAAGK